MAERTVTISGLSKTFSVTGWRLGYCIAPAAMTAGIRKAHDFLTVGAPHPLQMAGAAALALPQSYFDGLRDDYRRRRDLFLPYLREPGFDVPRAGGAYYVMTDFARLERPRRHGVRAADDRDGGRGGRAGEQLLQPEGAGPDEGAVHVRQAGRDAARGRRAAAGAAGGRWSAANRSLT